MSVESDNIMPVKAVEDNNKTSEALLQDVFNSAPMEMSRHNYQHHHHGGPYWPGAPVHVERPTSSMNATQYEVKDGQIIIKGR